MYPPAKSPREQKARFEFGVHSFSFQLACSWRMFLLKYHLKKRPTERYREWHRHREFILSSQITFVKPWWRFSKMRWPPICQTVRSQWSEELKVECSFRDCCPRIPQPASGMELWKAYILKIGPLLYIGNFWVATLDLALWKKKIVISVTWCFFCLTWLRWSWLLRI